MNKAIYRIWKWGFLTLLAIFLSGIIFASFGTPPHYHDEANVTKKYDHIPITLSKKQLNNLSAAYLKQYQDNDSFSYQFVVGEKYAIIKGKIEILGKPMDYAMTMIPSVTSNGNIKLQAHSLSVGSLALSPKMVLNYIDKNYSLPKWVEIDNNAIYLALNKIKTDNKVTFTADKVDINHQQFKFNINVPDVSK